MLEARLDQASLLKKLLDSIKELVTDANFECTEESINLQAMDNSHVALVSVKLEAEGFAKYRCDRPMPLGVNLNSLSKVLKCAKDDDQVTLKAGDTNDVLNLLYESPSTDRVAEYEMKLMDIDAEQLGIPDTDYEAVVTMSSSEFARIVRDLNSLGESVKIEVTKEGIKFVSEGDAANGSVLLKPNPEAARQSERESRSSKGAGSSKKTNGVKIKKEKTEDGDDDEDMKDASDAEDGEAKKPIQVEDDEEEEQDKENDKEAESDKAASDEEAEPEEDDEESSSKKRKRSSHKKEKSAKRSKKVKEEEEEELKGVIIEMSQPVNLTFSLKYLITFTKSTSLSKRVVLSMSNDVPLLVSYEFGPGAISYYLAPKIGDE